MACYVLGCREVPIVGVLHRRFGAVDSCIGHDAGKHGYGLTFGATRRTVVSLPAVVVSAPGGGSKVPRDSRPAPKPLGPQVMSVVDPF